jgi:hypothetical protein
MTGASRAVEHMKHAAHGGHGHHETGATSSLGMRVGATMAILGATLALFTVTGNSARTELLGLYTEQTIASLRAETSATQYRVVETQLRQLHALSPSRADVKSAEAELADIAAESRDAARAAAIARLAVKPVLSGIVPMAADLAHLARLTRNYRAEREAAMHWLQAFDPPKEQLIAAIEHYEWAELCAELGIVGSSLALLLASRRIWLATLALGAAGLLIFGWAFLPTRHGTHQAERAIAEAKREADACLEANRAEEDEDDALLLEIERGQRKQSQ